MLLIQIQVNEDLPFTKLGVHRVAPDHVKNGDICYYDIYEFTWNMMYEPVTKLIGDIEYPYGNGNLLTIEVLKFYENYKNSCAVSSTG